MSISERMFCIIEHNGLKPADLARELNINKSVISAWKKRNSNPPAEYLVQICKFLNVSLNYLVAGSEVPTYNERSNLDCVQFENTSQKIDYSNRVLHLKDDTIFTRFKEAREATGISLEDAAKGAFLTEEELHMLEEDVPIEGVTERMRKLQEIGLEQYAYLAYKYNVDLYWLLCGKVRPPAAVIQKGALAFPPYEFMMEGNERAATSLQPPMRDYSHLKLSEDEKDLLHSYNYLTDEGKGWVYDLILDYLKRRQKISYSEPLDSEDINGGTA